MDVKAERRSDYLQFICIDCGGQLICKYLGYDPSMPRVLFKCENCKDEVPLKFDDTF